MSANKIKAFQELTTILNYIRYIHNFEYKQLYTEEDVKIKVVLPLLKVLKINILHCNFERYTSQGKRLDISVPYGNENIIIEVKRRQITLTSEHVDQLKGYLRSENSQIGILTNGIMWEFYIYQDGQMEHIETLDLSYHTDTEEQEFLLNFHSEFFNLENILNYRNV